ncbi:MAG TPA: SRPBCC family protein [Vicinamibacterales bacterium]|nr:SRPBCC family protein [Vicinamibacterales bacterium]
METVVLESFEDQVAYSEVERWVTLATAGALMAYGFSRRNVPGMCLAVAAAPLVFKGVSGSWPLLNGVLSTDDTRVALSADRGIHVRESIRLEQPIAEVYRFWRSLENLPRFMTHLRCVTDLGNGRSHWEANGPAHVKVEWDAEIINDVGNSVIGWKSLPGSDVVTAGSVNFSTVRAGRSTQVSVHLQYSPPAGRAGALLASIFGRNPASMIREDLRRLKQLLEAGEVARADADAPGGRR